jgi:hypothetical protein
MTYFHAIRKTKIGKYSYGWVGRLSGLFMLLLVMGSPSFGSFIHKLVSVALVIYMCVMLAVDKVVDVKVYDLLKIEADSDRLFVYRDGKMVFDVPVHDIRQIWFEPRWLVRHTVVIELTNFNQHAVKLPVFSKKLINNLNDLLVRINSTENRITSRSS